MTCPEPCDPDVGRPCSLRCELAWHVDRNPHTGGMFYAGDIETGVAFARTERAVSARVVHIGPGARGFEVLLAPPGTEDVTWDTATEWGRCENGSPIRAWRYAIGALLAPARETVDA